MAKPSTPTSGSPRVVSLLPAAFVVPVPELDTLVVLVGRSLLPVVGARLVGLSYPLDTVTETELAITLFEVSGGVPAHKADEGVSRYRKAIEHSLLAEFFIWE